MVIPQLKNKQKITSTQINAMPDSTKGLCNTGRDNHNLLPSSSLPETRVPPTNVQVMTNIDAYYDESGRRGCSLTSRYVLDELQRTAKLTLGVVCIASFMLLSYIILFLLLSTHPHLPLRPHRSEDFYLEKDYARAFYYSWVTASETGEHAALEGQEGKVVSCYYNIPGPYDEHALFPFCIQPNLCTHINIAFATVVDNQIMLYKDQIDVIKDVVKMKSDYPNIKILLSVGGAGNDRGFPEMVKNHANRKEFIKSIKNVLRQYSLDGIDLDWEFPSIDEVADYPENRERQHFSQLLREIRAEYIREKRNYLLTVAVAAPEIIVDAAYDVDQINLYTDYVNIMTYDYHFYSKFTPFTGLNSPLYARPSELLYMATLNINYTVHVYLKKGLQAKKMVIGIPTYGHTFKLINPKNPNIGSPSSGFGFLGNSGFVDYIDLCNFVKNTKDVTIVKENSTKVPYLYHKNLWVSYDDPQSVIEKAQFIKDLGLGGAMIYSLNADDHIGVCEGDLGLEKRMKFPLLHAVKTTLDSESLIKSVEDLKNLN